MTDYIGAFNAGQRAAEEKAELERHVDAVLNTVAKQIDEVEKDFSSLRYNGHRFDVRVAQNPNPGQSKFVIITETAWGEKYTDDLCGSIRNWLSNPLIHLGAK